MGNGDLTFEELYKDLIEAANFTAAQPKDTFTVAQFAQDAGISYAGAAAKLLAQFRAGKLGRKWYGKKHFYWFKVTPDEAVS